MGKEVLEHAYMFPVERDESMMQERLGTISEAKSVTELKGMGHRA